LFCAACPQPGINMPAELTCCRWLYRRSIAADGFFSADHLKAASKSSSLDVPLSNGEGYMTERSAYEKHLNTATEYPQASKSTCHQHRSVNNTQDKGKNQHKDCTGIGAACCARHTCIVPGSVVDFVKGGERQMYMDYSICKGSSFNSQELQSLLIIYDVCCQWRKRFQDRLAANKGLSLPDSFPQME
ncbi:hypothetical protein BC835DRAFT_1302344, partial [Cytidiella melzeri]